jgi:uncharacterized protein YegJ (DUF2314 family)
MTRHAFLRPLTVALLALGLAAGLTVSAVAADDEMGEGEAIEVPGGDRGEKPPIIEETSEEEIAPPNGGEGETAERPSEPEPAAEPARKDAAPEPAPARAKINPAALLGEPDDKKTKPSPMLDARGPDYYDRRAAELLKEDSAASNLIPHPLMANYPDSFVVVCTAGCRNGTGAAVVGITPKLAATPAPAADVPVISCVGGCASNRTGTYAAVPTTPAGDIPVAATVGEWMTTVAKVTGGEAAPSPRPAAAPEAGSGDWMEKINRERAAEAAKPAAAPDMKPAAPAVAPVKPEAKPAAPVVAEAKPEAKPAAPAVAMTKPEAKPAAPVVAESKPDMKPAAPAVAPAVAPVKPEAKPAAPVGAEAKPEAKPTAPAIADVKPEAKPESKTIAAIETPKPATPAAAPKPAPAAPVAEPAAKPAVTPAPAATSPAAPDAKSAAPIAAPKPASEAVTAPAPERPAQATPEAKPASVAAPVAKDEVKVAAVSPTVAEKPMTSPVKEAVPGKEKVISVLSEDKEMNAAIGKARGSLAAFWKSYDAPAANESDHALKVAISANGNTEHFWLTRIKREGEKYSGLISNQPQSVKTVKMGQRYEFTADMVSDWTFKRNGKLVGNETMRVLLPRMPEEQAAVYRQMYETP